MNTLFKEEKMFVLIYCVALISIVTVVGMYIFGFIGE